MNPTISCIIVDDEPLAVELLKGYIQQIPQLNLLGTCNSAIEAFQLLNQHSVDLLLLDIEMPEMSGLDFIKSLSSPPKVILTTAYREYAIAGYEADVVDYLLKPISLPRFIKSIDKYQKRQVGSKSISTTISSESKPQGSIYVYSDKKNIRVNFQDILYIESIKDYIRIHLDSKTIISKDTISRYEDLLPLEFLRIHRSYIINKNRITAFTQHDVEIGKKEIPIGVSYKKKVIEKLKS